MLKKHRNNFLKVYETESFILQQKAKIFFTICIFSIILSLIVILLEITIINNIALEFILPMSSGILSMFILLWFLKKGYFYISANGAVILMSAMIWGVIFLDELEPLSRVDSISYILAIMTIASLAVTRNIFGILIYAIINLICLTTFVLYHFHLGLFSKAELIDYYADNTGALIIISIVCYQFYSISNKALMKAENEILRNVNLNKELDLKVKERTMELESTLKQLSETNEKLLKTSNQLWSEMELANKIQTMLIPDKPKMSGFEIKSFMLPAEQIGGDYYDIININEVSWILIGDVSGHGIPAGLIMMMAQTSVQTIVREHPDHSPAEILKSVNRAIQHNIEKFEDRKYMTISALKIKGDTIEYAGFHENILIYRNETKEVESIETRGMWLGVPFVSPFQDEVSKINIQSGDILLLYTDGITESFKDSTENQFGLDGLISILKKYGNENPNVISANVMLSLAGYEMYDDASLLLLKKK